MRRVRRRLAAAVAASLAVASAIPALAADPPVITGEAVSVDLHTGLVAVRHGPIEQLGLPRAGIDAFKVGEPMMLNAIQPGATIRFTADRVRGQLTITAMRP